jgi:hypothetical protein
MCEACYERRGRRINATELESDEVSDAALG